MLTEIVAKADMLTRPPVLGKFTRVRDFWLIAGNLTDFK